MIPSKLFLRNFMCYRDNVSPLHLDGIHLACLCGDNGNGKSALIDAITWALWGKSRAKSDDELIHLGQREMEVEFDFRVGKDEYRVIRKHSKTRLEHRGQTILDFQLATHPGFKSISGNSLGETQEKIIRTLHMDYLTFTNSAFLRQGHADEFTIKPPAERKKVLADILGLSFYDEFEERAKSCAKMREQQQMALQITIEEMQREIESKGRYEAELLEMRKVLAELEKEVKNQECQVTSLRETKKALDFKQEQLTELKKVTAQAKEELSRWQSQFTKHNAKIEEYERVLLERAEVEGGYVQLQKVKKESEELNTKLAALHSATERKANLEQAIERTKGGLVVEQKLWQSKVEELEAKSKMMATLEREFALARAKLNEIVQQEKELVKKRQQAQELALQIQYLQAANAQLKQEIEELKDKVALLVRSDVKCPLCETELGMVGKQRIEEKYKADILLKTGTQHRNKTEIKEKESERQKIEQELSQLELEIDQERATAQSRVATLGREISLSKEAAIELVKAKEHLADLEERLAKGNFALAEQQTLEKVRQQIVDLGYDAKRHQQVRQLLAELEKYELRQRKLEEAERYLTLEKTALSQAEEAITRWSLALEREGEKAAALAKELASLPELISRLNHTEQVYNSLRQQQTEARDRMIAMQEKLARCFELERKKLEKEQSLLSILREKVIYEELAEAFGKKGIQAFLIESAIPEIEKEANRLLSRMTDDRMRVNIETQRETKKGGTIETLEIKISDELGKRSYEMYSGGEAFRINFALRIALSKLLTKRAGAPLSTLFIDEGFGTQDSSGLGKLVEAINSIQDDFEKIIVITHLDELKDAFPVRIEVTKTSRGSTISVS